MKSPLVSIPKEYPNLGMIGNVLAFVTASEQGSGKKNLFFSAVFSGTAADFLCLAGEGTPEPYRQCMN